MRRTLHEWLDLAREAEDRDERARCLDAAAAEAQDCWEWRAILAVLRTLEPIDRQRLVDVADRTLATAAPTLEVWGFNDVAWVRHHLLDDPGGAALALEAGVQAFIAGNQEFDDAPARPYQWGLLARGYAACGDEVGARRCVEAGVARARALASADGLADLARELVDRGARDEAAALLREAEGLPSALCDAWGLANGWSRLDAPDEVRRVLESASIAATRCDDALRIARAFGSHQDHDGALRALSRAEALAGDAAEWFEVAESAVDVGAEPATIRGALERAASLPAGHDLRARIAAAFHQWLADPEAAARVGPRGYRPHELRAPRRSFPGHDTDADALFDRLRTAIERPSLEVVAAADYGHDEPKNLAALVDVCTSGLVPRALDFGLHEVLALTRWASGARVDHLARALSCVILLFASRDDDGADTVPILIESCLELGGDAPAQAIGLFVWLIETERPIEATDDGDAEDADPGAVDLRERDGPRPERDDPVESPAERDEQDEGVPESVHLLGLALLLAARDPDDPALATIASALAEHTRHDPGRLHELVGAAVRPKLWDDLLERHLAVAGDRPAIAAILDLLGRRGGASGE